MTAPKFHRILTTGDADGHMVTTVDLVRLYRQKTHEPLPAGTITITARVARRLLREVVGEAGRHHRVRFGRTLNAYIEDGCPVCMVGCALYRAGVSEDELAAMDAQGTVIGEVRLPARVRMTVRARAVFCAAQEMQDGGARWCDALRAALAVRPWQPQAVAA